MINEALIKMMARTLRGVGDSGTTKAALAALVECDIARPITTTECDDSLAWLQGKGYVASQRNMFDRDVFFLTQSGRNFLAQ